MIENYNVPLVLLSIGMALSASYTAVDLSLRVLSATGQARKFWYAGGSVALGVGVWGTHFIGMLAVELSFADTYTYDWSLTLISFLAAIIAAMIVLSVMSRKGSGWLSLFLSAVIMGVGISAMHYIGMLAMQIQPSIQYDPLLFGLSLVISIVVSFATLLIIYRLGSHEEKLRNVWVKLACAACMAAAILGMHYTAMMATTFSADSAPIVGSWGLGGDWLALLVGLGVAIVLLSSLIASIVDSRFADQNMRMADQLNTVNRKLIVHAQSLTQAIAEKENALATVKVSHAALVGEKERAERIAAELAGYMHAIDQHALISVTDAKGHIVQVNERFVKVSGYARDELLNQTHRIVNSGVHPKAFFVEMWRTLVQGKIWRDEICNRTKQGALYWIDTAIVPLKDDSGKIIRYLSVRVDVTKHKAVQAELSYAMDAAEAANEAKSRFLANMSHEIRTPMNSVLGMTHLLLRTAVDEQQIGYIANIQSSSQHLLMILNDVLDLSKIEAGKITLEAMDIDLEAMMNDIASQFSHDLSKKEITLVFDVAFDITQPFRGDALRLRQILLNYISNAIKFTKKGKITLCARILEEDEQGYLMRFEVHDTGIGIDEGHIRNLFQVFSQADSSSTRKYGGTGLGLAVSKELAELMGGSVGVESQLGKGSNFWFTARLGRGAKAITKKTIIQLPLKGNELSAFRILVVEDNTLNQKVAKEFLEYNGATVEIAHNGKEAIDILLNNERRFDCVLMDVQMPVMDGLEATRRIRADSMLADIWIIAMTANVDQLSRQLCLDAGMDNFIAKPIDPDLLVATLLKRSKPVAASTPSTPTTDCAIMMGTEILLDPSIMAASLGHNDPIQTRKYYLLFVTSTKESMKEIEMALVNADLLVVAALGHRIKSAALTVGAISFADLCKELESFKNGSDIVRAQEILWQMHFLIESIEKQLNMNRV